MKVMRNKQRPRTYARYRAFSRKGNEKIFESDGQYLLKLVFSVLLGSFWLKFSTPIMIAGLTLHALPVGVLAGLLLVRQFEKYQSNRKIWYAVIIVIGIVTYFVPAGIII